MENRREFIQKSILSSAFVGAFGWLSPLIAKTSSNSRTLPSYFASGFSTTEEITSLFELRSDLHYFNVSGLGPTSRVVLDQLDKVNRNLAKNGSDGRKHFSDARHRLASFVNADPDHLSFTRNTTEGMNLAANAIPFQEGDEIIISDHEHVGGAAPFVALQRSKGVKVRIAKLDPLGKNLLQSFKDQINSKTKAIVFCHVCCSNGMILPVKELVDVCKERQIYSVVDGAQAAGMLSLKIDELSPDFYAGSGHKWLYGPIGSGFLYTNKEVLQRLDPVFSGAYSDSNFDMDTLELNYLKTASRDEYGTRNSAQVSGLSAAIGVIQDIGLENIQQKAAERRQILYKQLSELDDLEILSPFENCHHAILSFKSSKISSKELVNILRKDHKIRLRYVYEGNLDAVRISIPLFTTDKGIEHLSKCLTEVLNA